MKRRAMRLRLMLFAAGAAAFALLFAWAVIGLPGAGTAIHSRYGRTLNKLCVPQRHATDVVTAINFDYRGFDTLGEEFILFISVMGTLVLLRQTAEKRGSPLRDAITPARDIPPSAALRIATLALTGPMVLFGLYVVTHGQLTPGGGFQGGVILASAPLLIYLAENFDVFRRVTSHPAIEILEALGAIAFAATGMLGWFAGRQYMANVLPLGKTGTMLSSGTIAVISAATGLEVGAGFLVLLYAFLQESHAKDGN